MKINTFMGGSRATYESPKTRVICIKVNSQILYTSKNYGIAGGNPEEDEESILG